MRIYLEIRYISDAGRSGGSIGNTLGFGLSDPGSIPGLCITLFFLGFGSQQNKTGTPIDYQLYGANHGPS